MSASSWQARGTQRGQGPRGENRALPCQGFEDKWKPAALLRATLIMLVFALLTGCGGLGSTNPPGAAGNPVYITFKAPQTYDKVLLTLTDLGMRPAAPCIHSTETDKNGQITQWMGWGPFDEGGNGDRFFQLSTLFAAATPLAPANWLDRLRANPTIKEVRTEAQTVSCPGSHLGTPPPGTPILLPRDQIGLYARVTFAGSMGPYDAALYAMSRLGLRLADPCYEQQRAHGTAPPWHPMGQQQGFAATHQLVVATTELASTQWQEQVRETPGVQAAEIPAVMQC
jgi:hypothetical protein